MESPQLAETDEERGLTRAQLTLLILGAAAVALTLLNALSTGDASIPSGSSRISAHPVMWQLFIIFGSAFARPLPILAFGIMFAFTAVVSNRMRALSAVIAFIGVVQFVLGIVLPVLFYKYGLAHSSTFPDSSIASFVSFYGFGTIVAFRRNRTRFSVGVACSVAVALLLYAAARLYFGIASTTDILGGAVVGVTIGALACLVLDRNSPSAP